MHVLMYSSALRDSLSRFFGSERLGEYSSDWSHFASFNCFSIQSATLRRISGSVALFLMRFANVEITAMLPGMYPFDGMILSRAGRGINAPASKSPTPDWVWFRSPEHGFPNLPRLRKEFPI